MPYEIYLTVGLAILFFSVGLGVNNQLFRKLSAMYSVAFLLISVGKFVEGQAIFADKLLSFFGYAMWVFIFYLNYRLVALERRKEGQEYLDALTGVKNRLYFEKVLKEKVSRYEMLGVPYVVFFFDMDNLKQINDTLGHSVGDEAIVKFAKALKENFRREDMIVRYGGDEFVVVASVRTCADALVILSRIEHYTEAINKGLPFRLSFSVGFSCFPEDGKNFNELLNLADKRMYEIKYSKKG